MEKKNESPYPIERTLAGLGIDKNADLDEAVYLALTDSCFLDQLLQALQSTNDVLRYNCFKTLLQIGDRKPDALSPSWEYFCGMLDSPNAFHRSIGAQLIAKSAGVDQGQRFEPIFDRYFNLLEDGSIVVARQMAQSTGRLLSDLPDMRERIIARLLEVERSPRDPERRDLIKTDILASLEAFADTAPERDQILAFAVRLLDSPSPKARKAAKAFLDKA